MKREDELERTAEILAEIKALEGRDYQLWSVTALVILVTALGLVAFLLPEIWDVGILRIDGRYLPQLAFAFVVLVVLFNIYAIGQRRLVNNSRQELVRQLLRADAAEKLSMTDALTGLFNRRYLDHLLSTEVKRTDRSGTALSLLIIDLNHFGQVNKELGHLHGDEVLKQVADFLQTTFRQSDTVLRFGGDEFVVVLTDTNAEQAEKARQRLLREVERLNRDRPIEGYSVSLSCGAASYVKGGDAREIFEAADRQLRKHKALQGLGHAAAAD